MEDYNIPRNRQAGGNSYAFERRDFPKNLEFMYTLYLPIKMSTQYPLDIRLPKQFKQLRPIIDDIVEFQHSRSNTNFPYVYLSVNHTIQQEGQCQQRPGWHVDGYGTDNEEYVYIARTRDTTIFKKFPMFKGPENHKKALEMFDLYGNQLSKEQEYTHEPNWIVFMNRAIHRAPIATHTGPRLFVKVTFSNEQFKQEGVAKNPLFKYNWTKEPRNYQERICPSKGNGD